MGNNSLSQVPSRRRFCALAGAVLLPGFSLPSLGERTTRSPFHASPNPHHGHFSRCDALRCCARRRRDHFLSDRCLDLTRYSSASVEALDMLASQDWYFADFGLEVLSDDIARTIRRIAIDHTTFHHLQWASAEAIAMLAARPEAVTCFDGIRGMNASGMRRLAGLLSNAPPDCQMTFKGDFYLGQAVAAELAATPVEIEMTQNRERGFSSSEQGQGALSVIAATRGRVSCL